MLAPLPPTCNHNSPPTLHHFWERHGTSNQESIYYRMWQSAKAQIAGKYSHTFMRAAAVKSRRRRLALQYRQGLLPTNKKLHQYKKASSPSCPLCGQEDSGHHAVSGCERLSAAYTARHNEAGARILRAVKRGARGQEVLMADVGHRHASMTTRLRWQHCRAGAGGAAARPQTRDAQRDPHTEGADQTYSSKEKKPPPAKRSTRSSMLNTAATLTHQDKKIERNSNSSARRA